MVKEEVDLEATTEAEEATSITTEKTEGTLTRDHNIIGSKTMMMNLKFAIFRAAIMKENTITLENL